MLTLFVRFILPPIGLFMLFKIVFAIVVPQHQFGIRDYLFYQCIYLLSIDVPEAIVYPYLNYENTIATYCIIIIMYFVACCIGAVLWHYLVMEPSDLDRYFVAYMMGLMENYKYNNLYRILNGPPPPNVYQLNFNYNHIYDCHICMDQFCKIKHGQETILNCGHRFHSLCLRDWELEQFRNNSYPKYQCPECRRKYNWRQKYEYVYMIKYSL